MPPPDVSLRQIIKTWWPLAASWLLMGAEMPAISAVMARLANPEINLAAYGGVVYPLALIIEAPIIMLLGASTALSKDADSYRKIRRFMMVTGAWLTVLHLVVTLTPLYYFVVGKLMGVPEEIIVPARIGMLLMTPWTWAIAYRRFNQGVLIRFGHSETVGIGTMIRLFADILILVLGYSIGSISGIVVATLAVSVGVLAEAVYVGIVVRPVIRTQLNLAPLIQPALTRRAFLDFYIPLAMTSLIVLAATPIGSAAISRMPQALSSLAAWPVVTGLVFMFRSLGIAYNEVVVARLDEPGAYATLHRFAVWLAVMTTLLLAAVAATPLSSWWFARFSDLPPELVEIARIGLWICIPMPVMAVFQSWYQGSLLYGRSTRGVTEAVVVYLVTNIALLIGGVISGRATGLYIGLAAMGISMAAQTIWLRVRSRPVLREIRRRDLDAVDPEISIAPAD